MQDTGGSLQAGPHHLHQALQEGLQEPKGDARLAHLQEECAELRGAHDACTALQPRHDLHQRPGVGRQMTEAGLGHERAEPAHEVS